MKAYKYLNKKDKAKILLTREFWYDSSERGIKKEEWERYDELYLLRAACGFCDILETSCNLCPLFKKKVCCRRYAATKKESYWKWKDAKTISKRKEYAKQILDCIDEYIKGEY